MIVFADRMRSILDHDDIFIAGDLRMRPDKNLEAPRAFAAIIMNGRLALLQYKTSTEGE